MSVLPLAIEGLSKSFGAVRALEEVDVSVSAGECLALLGENGAGKSTLVKILAGVEQPDAGIILMDGVPTAIPNPRVARDLGVCVCHQELSYVPRLTVSENALLGRERTRFGILRDGGDHERLRALLLDLGLDVNLRREMETLSVGGRQLVEIAKGLSQDAELVILDEPTSALASEEAERLFRVVRTLKSRGNAVIYISHRLDEIAHVADRVAVLRDGRKAGELPPSATTRDVVALMVGREIEDFYPRTPHEPSEEPLLSVKDLAAPPALLGISFSAQAGEILGIGGLVGSGYSELAHLLSGRVTPSSGSITIGIRTFKALRMVEALRSGLALVPEDRRQDGLNMKGSIFDNVTLPALARGERIGILSKTRLERLASEAVAGLRIRTSSLHQPVSALSGGNQQKVLLAKALILSPRILVLVEPTRGIDVGVKVEVYELLGRLAADGRAIVILSSDLNELRNVADRLVILYRGRVQGELTSDQASAEAVALLATGHSLGQAA